MTVEGVDHLQHRSRQHVDEDSMVQALLRAREPPAAFELAIPARPYQALAATLAEVRGGLLVVDDVGLGKTVTGICSMTRPDNLPMLVATLSHLPRQWEEEIRRFAPQLQTHILRSGRPYDLVPKPSRQRGLFDGRSGRMPDVIITNYHKLHGWAEVLSGVVRSVIYDEAQELRRTESLKYAAAAHIARRARLRIGLSATPIMNYGIEFHHVVDVLLPGVLGTREEFVREWCEQQDRIADPKAFGEYLRREGIMLRRTRADVGRELPRMSRVVQSVQSDRAALERIEGSAIELARTILAANESFRGQKRQAAADFDLMMRQATGVAKAPHVADFVRLLLEREQRVVVFAWHREVYRILLERLAEFNPQLYTGSETPEQKEKAKIAFTDADSRVLLISLRAGAGLDGLQNVCSTAVFAELDWSHAVHLQNEGRIRRDRLDGFIAACMAFYLLAEDGSDPVIADVLGIKRGQLEGVVDPDAALVEQLDNGGAQLRALAERYLTRHASGQQIGVGTIAEAA